MVFPAYQMTIFIWLIGLRLFFSVFQFFNPLVVNRSTQSGYSNQDQFCQLRHDYALFLIEIFEWVWWLFKFWWIFTNLNFFFLFSFQIVFVLIHNRNILDGRYKIKITQPWTHCCQFSQVDPGFKLSFSCLFRDFKF